MTGPSPIWANAKERVRVDAMRRGDVFHDYQGQRWTLDGGPDGPFWARREDGFQSIFAGCAEGVLVAHGSAP